MSKELRRLLVQALDTATPSLRDIAKQTRVSYHAIRRYRLGDRTPDPKVLRRLATGLQNQASRLQRLAARLGEASTQDRRPRG